MFAWSYLTGIFCTWVLKVPKLIFALVEIICLSYLKWLSSRYLYSDRSDFYNLRSRGDCIVEQAIIWMSRHKFYSERAIKSIFQSERDSLFNKLSKSFLRLQEYDSRLVIFFCVLFQREFWWRIWRSVGCGQVPRTVTYDIQNWNRLNKAVVEYD